jgi:hypothetical protein
MPEAPKEADKVAMELRKLRWELSIWARAATVAVPIAAFFVVASQTWIALQDGWSKDALALRDLELKRIETGVQLVEFTNAQTERLLSTDIEKRSQALTYASTLLPPQQACIVINAVIIASPGHADFVAPANERRKAVALLYVQQNPKLPAPPECTDDSIFSTQNSIAIAVAQAKQSDQNPGYLPLPALAGAAIGPSPSQAVTAAAQPAPLSSCKGLTDTNELPLVVYYQIVQATDRQTASRIGFEMPAEFPSAGIELVQSANAAKQKPEVRYYHPEQKSAAEWLGCMLTEAYTKIVGGKPRVNGDEAAFGVIPLAGRYKDLPSHRVEVWFPAIKS